LRHNSEIRTANLWANMVIEMETGEEAALNWQAHLLPILMDDTPDCIYIKDTESRFIANNAQHLRLIGAESLADLAGKTDLQVFPRDLAEQYYADEREVLRTGQPLLNREERVIDGQGRERWVLTSKVPLRDAQGRIIGLVGITRDITERKLAEGSLRRSEAALQESRAQLQALSRRLVEALENDRATLARELHDEAAQSLTALKLGLGRLRREAADPQALAARVEELMQLTDGLAEEMHRLAMNLRPASLDRSGLVPALEQYLEVFQRQTGLAVQFVAVGLEQERLAPEIETTLYRVTQEALTNVARHAHAKAVGIILERVEGLMRAIMEDDGLGFDVDEALRCGRLGLLGMRERVAMLGGTLSIESAVGSGTTVFAEIPLAHADQGI
jgi:two-component system, NarL family, sensor histidine kinase UhpB